VKDEERAGRPSTSIIDSNVEDARAMILENRQVSIDVLANHFEISMVLHMTSFITGLAFVKSVQVGFLKSSPKSKRTIV